jgi:hypothetical protein
MCDPQMTMLSAVFVSPATVRVVQAYGLDCKSKRYQRAAGMYANIATLEAAHGLGMQYSHAVMIGAARCNAAALAVVQFLHAQGCRWSSYAYDAAAESGNTALCAYLHASQCPWTEDACDYAAMNGHGSTLRWLHEHGCPWDARGIAQYAVRGGSADVMTYLQQQGIVFTAGMLRDMLQMAGVYNKLAAAKWLRQQGAEWPAVL